MSIWLICFGIAAIIIVVGVIAMIAVGVEQ